jgi:pSer/pThr/pTyr-binding forkhead associated (FHA) protein
VDFDALRAAVVPGAGVVGRWPGVVCVAECADRHVLRQLLDVCASAAGPEPGRALARRLTMWLGSPDAPGDGLRFGTVAVTGADPRSNGRGEQWAVFLYGPVGLVVPDRQVALSGAQSVAWTDRLLPRPDAPVVLALEGGPIPPGLVDGVHDLRAGVVPGAGAVLVPTGDQVSSDIAEEPARTRPAESRWLDAAGGDRQWGGEPVSTAPSEGLYADGPGNGTPSRGSLGVFDSYHPGDSGESGTERPSGRPHLRPVPSGSNGVAHRGWAPRRGSAVDVGGFPEADQDHPAGPPEDDPADPGPSARAERSADHVDERRSPGRDELRGPDVTARGIGDEHAPDAGPRGSRNGAHGKGATLNGATYDLLGGPDAPQKEAERSPWSDGRGRAAARPERIEGWFATPEEAGTGTETGLSPAGPSDRRRRRHGLPDDDVPAEGDPASTHDSAPGDGGGEGGDDSIPGDFSTPGDFGAPGAEPGPDAGAFGSGSVEETRLGGMSPIALPGAPPADGEALDGSGDGTPRLGVPTQEAPPEPERAHPLADADGDADAPRTTALRSERILGAPGEADRSALEDSPATSGLVVDSRQDEQRPPLGLLVFDDGTTYTVDAEYLMGRMPEADPRVASGALRSLALEDTSGAVSRVHAQIVVNGWDALLVDVGSRNGTFVSPPGEQGWTQLPAGETHRLVPGTRVRIGGRSFQFEAPSGAH